MVYQAIFHWLEPLSESVYVLLLRSESEFQRYVSLKSPSEWPHSHQVAINRTYITALQDLGAVSYSDTRACATATELLTSSGLRIPDPGAVPDGWPCSTWDILRNSSARVLWDVNGILWVLENTSNELDEQFFHKSDALRMQDEDILKVGEEIFLNAMLKCGAIFYPNWRDSEEARIAREDVDD
jgi:hypothetical protein